MTSFNVRCSTSCFLLAIHNFYRLLLPLSCFFKSTKLNRDIIFKNNYKFQFQYVCYYNEVQGLNIFGFHGHCANCFLETGF